MKTDTVEISAVRSAAATAKSKSSLSIAQLDLFRNFRGGFVTFLSSLYIIILIPAMLNMAGQGEVTSVAATAFACTVGTLIFALGTRLPFAVGPGIVPTSIIASLMASGMPFSTIMGIEFFAGVIFMSLAISGGIKAMVGKMSPLLKMAGSVAIGVYLLLAAFKASGIVNGNMAGLRFHMDMQGAVFLAGFAAVFIVSQSKRFGGYAILGGIILAAIGSAVFNLDHMPTSAFAMPSLKVHAPDLYDAFSYKNIGRVLILLYVVVVDVVATLETMASVSPVMQDYSGRPKNFDRSITMSAVVFMISPFLGAAPMLVFFESLGGVFSGARGLKASAIIVVGFAIMIFLSPLAQILPAFACAVGLGYIGYVITKFALTGAQKDATTSKLSRLSLVMITVAMGSVLLTHRLSISIFAIFALYPLCAFVSSHQVKRADLIASAACILLAYSLFFN